MRTTVTLDEDVARAVEDLRLEQGLGTSAAVNSLVRRGLGQRVESGKPFRQRVSKMGPARIPLDNIGAALEVLEENQRGH